MTSAAGAPAFPAERWPAILLISCRAPYSQAACSGLHSAGLRSDWHQVGEVIISGCGQFEGGEADVMQGLMDAVDFISVLHKLGLRKCGVAELGLGG